jgi:non-homologous end joining protein Ku
MAASPRTVPNGSLTIRLGLLSMPVTIGKSWSDEREKNLRELCSCCNLPVDRTERCPTKDGVPNGKVKGVQRADGTWHVLAPGEVEQIESVKSKILSIEETVPLKGLPMIFATGAYYVRHDEKRGEGTSEVFATFAKGLETARVGALVKWGSASRERLGVLHAHQGIVFLTMLPMKDELRLPGEKEKAHQSATTDPEAVSMLTALLDNMKSESFDHSKYVDEGLRLRTEAVDRVLAGDVPPAPPKADSPKFGAIDLIATLKADLQNQAA